MEGLWRDGCTAGSKLAERTQQWSAPLPSMVIPVVQSRLERVWGGRATAVQVSSNHPTRCSPTMQSTTQLGIAPRCNQPLINHSTMCSPTMQSHASRGQGRKAVESPYRCESRCAHPTMCRYGRLHVIESRGAYPTMCTSGSQRVPASLTVSSLAAPTQRCA